VTYTVEINKIQPAFNKAHQELWKTKNPEGKILLGLESAMIQGSWWMEEYGVLVYGDRLDSTNNWTHADFPSEAAFVYFILKWK
jgi:hypothetical protein